MSNQTNSECKPRQRRFRIPCEHIDTLPPGLESILQAPASQAASPKHIPNTTPAERRTVEDCISPIRGRLVQTLPPRECAAGKGNED